MYKYERILLHLIHGIENDFLKDGFKTTIIVLTHDCLNSRFLTITLLSNLSV